MSKKKDKHSEQNEHYKWESNKILFDASFKETHALAANIITLSTGFLGTTLVFFEKLEAGTPVHSYLLLWGSIALIICIILVVIIRIMKLESLDFATSEDWDKCATFAKYSKRVTYFSALVFILGISFITTFLLSNLVFKEPKMSKEPRKPSSPPSAPIKSPSSNPKPLASPGRRSADSKPSYNPGIVRPPSPPKPGKP